MAISTLVVLSAIGPIRNRSLRAYFSQMGGFTRPRFNIWPSSKCAWTGCVQPPLPSICQISSAPCRGAAKIWSICAGAAARPFWSTLIVHGAMSVPPVWPYSNVLCTALASSAAVGLFNGIIFLPGTSLPAVSLTVSSYWAGFIEKSTNAGLRVAGSVDTGWLLAVAGLATTNSRNLPTPGSPLIPSAT